MRRSPSADDGGDVYVASKTGCGDSMTAVQEAKRAIGALHGEDWRSGRFHRSVAMGQLKIDRRIKEIASCVTRERSQRHRTERVSGVGRIASKPKVGPDAVRLLGPTRHKGESPRPRNQLQRTRADLASHISINDHERAFRRTLCV